MDPCSECYQFTLSACPDSDLFLVIQPSAGMVSGTDYWWFLKDKFDRMYLGHLEFDSGFFNIPISEFPDGYFTEFSGAFTLYFKANLYDEDSISITLGGNATECIVLDFKKMNGNYLVVK